MSFNLKKRLLTERLGEATPPNMSTDRRSVYPQESRAAARLRVLKQKSTCCTKQTHNPLLLWVCRVGVRKQKGSLQLGSIRTRQLGQNRTWSHLKDVFHSTLENCQILLRPLGAEKIPFLKRLRVCWQPKINFSFTQKWNDEECLLNSTKYPWAFQTSECKVSGNSSVGVHRPLFWVKGQQLRVSGGENRYGDSES